MKKILLLICVLQSGMLSAQPLYFLRATVDENYDFYSQPPVQTIAYVPEQDTVLQVYKDFTKNLYPRYQTLSSIVYYPQFNVFVFELTDFTVQILNTDKIDTVIEITTQCLKDYYVSPYLAMNIVNNHWAYRCSNHNAAKKKDVYLFKGFDFSLNNHFDLKASDFKDLYLTGANVQNVYLKPNDSLMYLPIVADIENRPPFSVNLPKQYWVSEETLTRILVNDDLQTLLALWDSIPHKGEDYGHFHGALYSKTKNRWSDLDLKGNVPALIAYGSWLAGVVQDRRSFERNFTPKYPSPGRATRDSVEVEYDFDDWTENYGIYRPGILYLFNTDTEKYIEWNTGQGDSEILLVQDETVYYRVFDAIYKAPIVNGETLGQSELLAKDNQIVPQIHWAFFGQ